MSEPPEGDERPPFHMPRSLHPQFLRAPPRTSRAVGRPAAAAGLIIAASIGAAIALFATGNLPSEMNKILGFGANTASKLAGDTKKPTEEPGLAAAQPAITRADPRPIGETARVVSVGATERTPTICAVTDDQIRHGISAPFTGAVKSLGTR